MPEFGPSARDDDNRGANSSRLINCYRQPVPGADRAALKSVLGTQAFANTGGVLFRAATGFKNQIFTVQNGRLYRVDSAGASTDLGAVSIGDTSFSANGDYLTIAAGGRYYALLGNTLTEVPVTAFTNIGSVDFLGQYTLLTEAGGSKWSWSDLANPTVLPALNFATAEEDTNDNLLRVKAINGRVVLFKGASREIWARTSASGANAFQRLAVRSTGLKAYNLLAKVEDAIFYIGSDNIARLTVDGFQAQKFSYPPVDTAIAQGNATDCFFYEDEGQKHVVVRFSDRPSWVLDLATTEWHERADTPDHEPWPVRGTAKLGASYYAVTDQGAVWKLLRNNADVNGAMRRTAVSQTFYFPEYRSVDLIEIFGRVGFSNLGRAAQMWLRVSRDGGDTWSPEKWRSMGDVGNHDVLMRWRAQGVFRQFTIEANVSDPAELPLYSDYLVNAA